MIRFFLIQTKVIMSTKEILTFAFSKGVSNYIKKIELNVIMISVICRLL